MLIIPNRTKVNYVRFSPSFQTVCEVSDIPFQGTIEIEYEPDAWLLEFEAVQAWINTLEKEKYTIESYCDFVFDYLSQVLANAPLRVTVHATTRVHATASAMKERNMRKP